MVTGRSLVGVSPLEAASSPSVVLAGPKRAVLVRPAPSKKKIVPFSLSGAGFGRGGLIEALQFVIPLLCFLAEPIPKQSTSLLHCDLWLLPSQEYGVKLVSKN